MNFLFPVEYIEEELDEDYPAEGEEQEDDAGEESNEGNEARVKSSP